MRGMDPTRVNWTLLIRNTVLESGSLAPESGPFSRVGGPSETLRWRASGQAEECRPLSCPPRYKGGGLPPGDSSQEQKTRGPRSCIPA